MTRHLNITRSIARSLASICSLGVSLGAALLLAACGSSRSTPAPTATLTAAQSAVSSGGATTLTWSSTNATTCSASGGWSGSLAASGTQSTGALTAQTSYSLTCTGAGGTSTAATATVAIVPTATLTADPTALPPGSAATLTWSSTDATACAASDGWSGALAASGTQSTGALAATTSYSLTCTGPGGSSTAATAVVTVGPPPAAILTANPPTVPVGGASTLTWSSTNATACSASGGWSGALAASGTQSTGTLTATTSYSLTCAGAGGSSTAATATVTVAPPPTATLSAKPTTVTSGGASTLTWTSTNATSCTAAGGWAGPLAASGTQSSGPVTAATSFSLTCTGAGGTSTAVTALVSLPSGTVTLSPKIAAITLTQTRQFTVTGVDSAGVTWTVDNIPGGNSTVGLINATGLYTAGTAPGAHTVLAIGVTDTTQSGTAVAAVTDLAGVYTYHNNIARDGANTQEYALTPSSVSAGGFGKLTSCTVDGAIYAQPLWVANLTVNGAKHNVVIVPTMHNSVYAFDADASPCVPLWTANLLDVAHGGAAGETSVPYQLLGNGVGDIQPEVGVNSTPVIDPSTGILYVLSKSVDSTQTIFYQRLHAIDVSAGGEKTGSPVTIAGSVLNISGNPVAFEPRGHSQRPGLALVNGTVYIAWASHEDHYPWYGWMMAYRYSGTSLAQTAIFNATPNSGKGGFWMSGGAPSADSSNNLYVATGNGSFNLQYQSYGDSLLQLTGALQLSKYFTPTNQLDDESLDHDFGSGGTAVLADLPAGSATPHVVICGGKDGFLYVLNRDNLGGFGDNFAVQKLQVGKLIFSTGAYWNNTFYIGGLHAPMSAYKVSSAAAPLSAAFSVSSNLLGSGSGTPSVSAAAATNGIVWALDNGSFCTNGAKTCGPTVLYAYDATNLTTPLWNSAANAADYAGNSVKFSVPTVANGKVYVATRGNNIGGVFGSTTVSGQLDIYGFKP